MESKSLFDNESRPTCDIDFLTHEGQNCEAFRLSFDPYHKMEETSIHVRRIESKFKVEQKKCKNLIMNCALISQKISNSAGMRNAIVLQTKRDIFVI